VEFLDFLTFLVEILLDDVCDDGYVEVDEVYIEAVLENDKADDD
jgi:hypothetical protein